jgi:uncharacterized membrane protein HdeD (DUF308 family)
MAILMADKAIERQRRPLVSGIIWLGLGIYFLLLFNEVLPSPESSWPVVLIIIGAAFIVRGIIRK